MADGDNPTHTKTIRANWDRDINRRWAQFKRTTVRELRRLNIQPGGQLFNAEVIFAISPTQQRSYMAFLEAEINRLLLGTTEAPNWQAQYQTQAYQRGIEATRRSLISQGASIVPTAVEVQASTAFGPFTATPSIGVAPAAPIHQEGLAFLHSRSFDKLNGWTDAMAVETKQILFDGFRQGKGIEEVVREMVDRQEVSRTRARVIAKTETIQAYQRSTTAQAELASEEIGEEILLRWLSTRLPRVRHLHTTWHGTLSTPKENLVRIGISPWNCECAQVPVIPEANTPEKQKKFDKQRETMLLIERK